MEPDSIDRSGFRARLARASIPAVGVFVGGRRLVRQVGGRGAQFSVRNRCNLPRRAHQLASAYQFAVHLFRPWIPSSAA